MFFFLTWKHRPLHSTIAIRARLAAASGAREVGTFPIAMHLQDPGEVDCRNQKVLSSKKKMCAPLQVEKLQWQVQHLFYLNDPLIVCA